MELPSRTTTGGAINNLLPEIAVCAFPIVVVDGPLFRVLFEESAGELQLHPADHVRCHWRGAPSWELHATVDVVRLDSLDAYLAARRPAFHRLVELLVDATQRIAKAHAENCLETLVDRDGGSGLKRLVEALSIKLPPLT